MAAPERKGNGVYGPTMTENYPYTCHLVSLRRGGVVAWLRWTIPQDHKDSETHCLVLYTCPLVVVSWSRWGVCWRGFVRGVRCRCCVLVCSMYAGGGWRGGGVFVRQWSGENVLVLRISLNKYSALMCSKDMIHIMIKGSMLVSVCVHVKSAR